MPQCARRTTAASPLSHSLGGFDHALLPALLAGPVEADFVTVGVVEVGVPPTPFHHAWHLGDVEALSDEAATEIVESSNLKVEPHSLAHERRARAGLMERNGPIASRRA